jgi:hypothetical protein
METVDGKCIVHIGPRWWINCLAAFFGMVAA